MQLMLTMCKPGWQAHTAHLNRHKGAQLLDEADWLAGPDLGSLHSVSELRWPSAEQGLAD